MLKACIGCLSARAGSVATSAGRDAGDLVETVEDEGAAGGLEGTSRSTGLQSQTSATLDQDGGGVPLRGGHLAGDEALPDDLVEAEVVGAERVLYAAGGEVEGGRADGLVGFLGGLVG
jgi:hypothetical protein